MNQFGIGFWVDLVFYINLTRLVLTHFPKLGGTYTQKEEEDFDPIHKGKVAFLNYSKVPGFLSDIENREKHFVHGTGLGDEINENDRSAFELKTGPMPRLFLE